MNKIYYFNINYYCNNKCMYCFSSSTKNNKRQIDYLDFVSLLQRKTINSGDIIVINGGEPTLHPYFYEIINSAYQLTNSNIIIYTNGRKINISDIPKTNRVNLVIPLHGDEASHDSITQINGSFKETIESLKALTNKKTNFSIKFILNKYYTTLNINPIALMHQYGIRPSELVIARLNETKISKFFNVPIPDNNSLKKYLKSNINSINNFGTVKYIDIPPCILGINQKIHFDNIVPEFFFSDDNFWMLQRNYFKQVKIGDNCRGCHNEEICDIMKMTYLTLQWDNNWKIVLE